MRHSSFIKTPRKRMPTRTSSWPLTTGGSRSGNLPETGSGGVPQTCSLPPPRPVRPPRRRQGGRDASGWFLSRGVDADQVEIGPPTGSGLGDHRLRQLLDDAGPRPRPELVVGGGPRPVLGGQGPATDCRSESATSSRPTDQAPARHPGQTRHPDPEENRRSRPHRRRLTRHNTYAQ